MSDKINIAALVILYNPDKNVTINIKSYLSLVKTTYVIDNSESEATTITEEIKRLPNVVYTHAIENRGIAKALNGACITALKEAYHYLLTMDQDSYFHTDAVRHYFNCIADYSTRSQTAMFGIQFNNPNTTPHICVSTKTEKLITSGSVINLNLFNDIGGFDENLFIDEVDNEFCYRSILKGYQIVQFSNIYLEHSLGTISFHKSLRSLNQTPRRLHSSIRIYYMTRNFLYIRSKYRKYFPASIKSSKHALLINIKNNLFYNRARIKVMQGILQAYIHFKRKKMGKCN